uniref:Primase C terminal 1 n=1 Tax=Desulfovibrio sp. U5L TaxID=596152 RepID=I2PWX5_9BACT
MFEDLSPPAQRFFSYLSNVPRWGNDKIINFFGKKEDIINIASYIELPNHRRYYMSFDLDYEGAAYIWVEENLPQPTITIINNQNAHATLHYELTTAVLLQIRGRDSYFSWRAKRYYDNVRESLRIRMDGDKGYAGFNTKNPLYKSPDGSKPKWKVYWYDKTYDLDYLNEFGSLTSGKKEIVDIDPNSRHMTLFNSCRKQAYSIVKDFTTFEGFNGAVHKVCNDFYSMHIQHIKKDHSFPQSEIDSIARSIANWTWSKRNDPHFSNYTKNKGIMNLQRTFTEKNSPEHLEEIKSNQQLGAYYAHDSRIEKTEEKIANAMNYLVSNEIQVTIPLLCQQTGLSKSTIYRYKNLIDSLDIK